MYRLAIVAALAAGCGDGGTVGSDATVGADAGDRGIVRVKVTGFVEKAGLHVYFQESDSTLSLSTVTNANGEATGRLGPDGFVTLSNDFEPGLTLWTYTGVQPGDELEFFRPPDIVGAELPKFLIGVFAPDAGAPSYLLRNSCGGAFSIFDELPVGVLIDVCGEHADFTLEKGQVYRYAKDVDLTRMPPRVDFDGEFVDYALSTVIVTGAPPAQGFASATQALIARPFPLVTTSNRLGIVDGERRAVLGLPLPANASMLTEIDLGDTSLQHIIDWRPTATSIELTYDFMTVAPATQSPRYDATTTSIVWSEGSGTPGDLVRATLHWLDGMHSRTRNWVIVGPRSGPDPVLRVPLLPAPDLVPTVEIPNTMESFVVGDQLEYLRRHMHGRWLAQGVTWPTNGDAGHVVWRSLY